MPIHIIPNILNEEDIDIVIEQIVNNKDFQKSNTEIETYEIIEDIKFPQELENNSIIILDDFNQKKWTILEFKQCLSDLDIIIYLFL